MAANKLTNFTKVLHKTDRASEVLVFDGQGNTSSIKPEDLVIGTATKLESPVTVTLTGDVEGTFNFDGSEITAVSSSVTVNDNSHAHIISNVLGLQDELDTLELNKLDKATFNAVEVKSRYESNADTNAFTDAYKTKLTNIESGAEVNTVDSVNGYTGSVVLDKSDIGLSNVTNDVQLKRDSNLSDVPNPSTARTNLGLAQVASTGNFSDMSGEIMEGQLSSSLVSKINDTLPYNVDATTAPTSNDDSSEGWKEGSLWIDNNNNEAYRCVDSSVGAAVWINTTLTTEELSTVAVSGSYNDLLNKPSNATTTTSGFMSPSDKTKLNSVESGAEVNEDTNLSSSASASSYSIESSTGTGTTLNSATQTLSGVLSASDKTKLDNIEANAQVNTVDSVNSKTGSVILNTDDVSEGLSNQYFTTTRARNSISVTGDLTYSNGVISFNETYSTPSEVKTAYESNTNTNAFTDSEKSKLSGIESGAEVNDVEEAPINGNQYARQDGGWSVVNQSYSSATELLDAIKTVDGSGSGLDADLLDGLESSEFLRSNVDINNLRLSDYGNYYPGSGSANIDEAPVGDIGLYATTLDGTFPTGSQFFLITTQKQYSNNAVVQHATSYHVSNPIIAYRTTMSENPRVWTDWVKVYHTGNFDPSTKLDTTAKAADSDKLDGKEFGSNVGDVMAVGDFGWGRETQLPTNGIDLNTANLKTGIYSGNNWSNTPQGTLATNQWGYLIVENLASAFPNYTKQTYMYNGDTSSIWIRRRSAGNWTAWAKQWGENNDGPGSGLDADTIDGYQAQDFAYPNQPQIANITLTGDFA